jgi:IS5 family transposase
MRVIIRPQLPLVHPRIDHPHAAELQAISDIIDAKPETVALVLEDIVPDGVDVALGRMGMTGEQVLRALIVKQMNGYSYEQLAFHLADSKTYQAFCRIGVGDEPPSKSTLQSNIKRIRPETLEAINRIIVTHAKVVGIESGDKARIDSTVTETNIHHPTDSSLLGDCVRVLTRIMHRASKLVEFDFEDHSRRAKHREMEILNARTNKDRLDPYKDLLKVTLEVTDDAERALGALKKCSISVHDTWLQSMSLVEALEHYIKLSLKIVDQAARRVVQGQKVPSDEKVVSIFEPHTDIIVKDRRDTLYGHKICLTGGASNLVLDCVIGDGNPADSSLATEMIRRLEPIIGKVPRQASFDGGFASADNLDAIKALGVEDVVFAKRRGIEISDMVKDTWVYKTLRNFRAGIEGTISYLKRCFAMDRCTWRGLASFKAYVWSSIISANLLIMAKHMLA